MEKKDSGTRLLQFDLLRIIACFSVVMLHCSAQFWYILPMTDSGWLTANFYDAVSRFGVPIFVMISGALFLSEQKKFDVRRLYTHNILRLLSVYVFWSCLYGLLNYQFTFQGTFQWKPLLKYMLHGRYHLWFLPMIIGLYLLLPVLQVWVHHADRKNLQYFLALFFVFQICRNTFTVFFPGEDYVYLASLADFDMICGYMGYFILGHYLTRWQIPLKFRRLLYLTVPFSLFCNVFLSAFLSRKRGEASGDLFDSFSIFTFLITAALFLSVTEGLRGKRFSAGAERVIREVSRNTLGIYVMHVGVIEILGKNGIHSMTLPIAAGIPLLAVFCFLFCGLLSALLRRIPLVGKYIC